MNEIGRNDPCPCGSGKKFKKCHMGREEELVAEKLEYMADGAADKITALPEVNYGRCREIMSNLDVAKLTKREMGVKFIDLGSYLELGFTKRQDIPDLKRVSAGQLVNPLKTTKSDPENIYVAVSPAVSDSTLIHQLAHVLDFLAGSGINPGIASSVSEELEVPGELLEHPKEFGDWLEFLRNEFSVELDAEDTIVAYLHETGHLLTGDTLKSENVDLIKGLANRTITFLRANREEIDRRIKNRAGYIQQPGARQSQDS